MGDSKANRERSREHLGRAQYAAIQYRSAIRIYAVGFNPTTGYTNYFQQTPLDIWPPQFEFYSVPPESGATVVTFFEVHTTFAAFEDVKEVVVYDADGEHKIPVVRSVVRAEGGDGPFPLFGR
jgi:hypothetical protein